MRLIDPNAAIDVDDLAGWLRKTIVDDVMRQIRVPVLTVPAGGVPRPAPGERLRVLVPLDGSALAESALVHMLGIARRRPLEIRLRNKDKDYVVRARSGYLAGASRGLF